jgi:copper chaperone
MSVSAVSTYRFRVDGMTCGSCGMLVDDAVEDIPGVRRSETSARTGLCAVEVDAPGVDPGEIVRAIGRAGYGAALLDA